MGRNKALQGKSQIIEAAERLLDRDGEEALSIRNLSQELGVAPMTIYNYLKNIDDIKREVLILFYNRRSREILEKLSQDHSAAFTRVEWFVTVYVDVFYDFAAEHSEFLRFVLGTGYVKFHDDAELRHFLRPLEVFYSRKSEKDVKLAYHLCEDMIYMMLRNHVENRDVLTKEEMEYRARFIVNKLL